MENHQKTFHYNHLIGKDKKQIKDELGQELNFYPDEIWTYELKKNWWGRKTILQIEFKENKVREIKILRKYG